jgi:hypothetical protein
VVLGIALLLHSSSGRARGHDGVLLAIAAGVMIGVGNVAIKALSGTFHGDLMSLISPWTLLAVGAGLAAFMSLARGLQLGAPIQVIALSSIAANVAAIAGGVLVFGDPVGSDALGIVARSAAFAAVIAAAALLPAPRTPQPAGAPA